jgi:hypothetical protein
VGEPWIPRKRDRNGAAIQQIDHKTVIVEPNPLGKGSGRLSR